MFVYAFLVSKQRLGKHVLAATKNRRRLRFLYGPWRIKGEQAISYENNFLLIKRRPVHKSDDLVAICESII
jgi:hypothetical protein